MESGKNLNYDSTMQSAPPSYIQTEASYSMQDPRMQAQMMGAPVCQPVMVPQAYAQQQSPQVHIIQQGGGFVSVGPKPVRTKCPNCHADIQTKTSSTFKGSAHLWCLALCLLGCWPCYLIPYCMDSYKNVEHSCPNCNARVGGWSG